MTTPFGHTYFLSCPHCQAVLRRATLRSGNTFGSTLWSDGYLDAPMLPNPAQIARCPSCVGAFFIADAESLGQDRHDWEIPAFLRESLDFEIKTLPDDFQKAPWIQDVNPEAFPALIAQTKDHDRLRYLYTRIWHSHNHAQRKPGAPGEVQKPVGFIENLALLIDLLKDDYGQEQLLRAEAVREIGMHDEAILLLQDIKTEFAWAADQIRAMALAGNATVSVLLRPGEKRQEASVPRKNKARKSQ